MMNSDIATCQEHAFYALVRAGLWEREAELSADEPVDFKGIYRLAQEQSVIGLVAAGLEHVIDIKVPEGETLTLVGQVVQLEQQNRAMNGFIAELISKMRRAGICALLVKGQGIAQCYERPLWRACGDVDLLLNSENYQKAKIELSKWASKVEKEGREHKHLSMTIDAWTVELHGTLRSLLWKSLDKTADEVQDECFRSGKVRTWMNEGTQVLQPREDEDVILVFAHILQHFFRGGIGLRQICDWCRLLWTYRDTIDRNLLRTRLKRMGVMTEWRAFAALAVDYLGMPIEAMPFYSPEGGWRKKADKILAFVVDTGNFGHNRSVSYYERYPYVFYKAISLWRHTKDCIRYLCIFPLDAIKVWCKMIAIGVKEVIDPEHSATT